MSGDRGSRANPAVQLRNIIRREARKAARKFDQVMLGTVSDVGDGDNVGVLLDGFSGGVLTMTWSTSVAAVVAQRVTVLSLAGQQTYIVIGVIGATKGGVDHGALVGLAGDDHSLYHNDARAQTWFDGIEHNIRHRPGGDDPVFQSGSDSEVGNTSIGSAAWVAHSTDTFFMPSNWNTAKILAWGHIFCVNVDGLVRARIEIDGDTGSEQLGETLGTSYTLCANHEHQVSGNSTVEITAFRTGTGADRRGATLSWLATRVG